MGLLLPDVRHRRGDGETLIDSSSERADAPPEDIDAARFHDAASLIAALRAGGRPIASALGMAAFAGPAFLLACVIEAGAAVDDVIIDCGADTGRALEAVRLGAHHVALAQDAPGRARAAALIAASGARLHLL